MCTPHTRGAPGLALGGGGGGKLLALLLAEESEPVFALRLSPLPVLALALPVRFRTCGVSFRGYRLLTPTCGSTGRADRWRGMGWRIPGGEARPLSAGALRMP